MATGGSQSGTTLGEQFHYGPAGWERRFCVHPKLNYSGNSRERLKEVRCLYVGGGLKKKIKART